ncbi:A disintegrin and metalloproteinase with thrombospondin motifs 9 [Anopheles moucheti]|uniref:A disintegrin and metalloproteinase with thrombospondin motifs 9 n=1 Tax=Anopheles moucheti TaxID=186751 RepID=UPI0022EFF36A|nr:A disintegrin and metalloproteinase with thrombospondin motifs 9 [Anopheles moucheti]
MTTRWYSSGRRRICFLVVGIVCIIIILIPLAPYIASYSSQPSTPNQWQMHSSNESELVPTTREPFYRISYAQSPPRIVMVGSEHVPPYETPPNDTSPDGSGTSDGNETAMRESTLRLPEVNDGSGSNRVVSSVSDGHISTNSIISNNIDNDDVSRTHKLKNGTFEYAYITKLVRPLHQDDLLYESKADVSDGRRSSQIHATGAFRSRSSKIWDPHPEYELNAFGVRMHLKLSHDAEFIPKDMKVTHFWPNETVRKPEDHDESRWLQGCYYKGSVVGDAQSTVRVSLCEGMHGHIKTTNASFIIEPAKNVSSSDASILHRIQRLMADKSNPGNDGRKLPDGSNTPAEDCAVRTDHEAAERLLSIEPTDLHSRNRRSIENFPNNEYTVEVLVVVDNKMERYHGADLKSYVLTLMSIVSSVYADASIGSSMKIAVSHISYIHHDLNAQIDATEKGLVGVSASDMLQDFCRFKQSTNIHHDAALLLTREQICRNPVENNCDTLGLAELGTICGKTACAIVQDNGLSASFTIAHELGHVLGMPHDDDSRCQRYRGDSSGNNRIMSRTIDHNTHPWQWSNCSRQILSEYFEKNPDNCLLNHPSTDLMSPDTTLAGEKFTNNKQCELVFGNGSKICSYMPTCARLWCSWENELSGCKTQHMPWADGTECQEGHWCQKGQCVPIDRTALKPQNGGWSGWSSYDGCSRTCGGGVQKRTRECDSPKPKNGGKFCIGLRIEYRACNTHACPNSRYNFREEQCHEFHGQHFDVPTLEPNVRWIPKYGTPLADQCKLFCRAENKSLYFMLREKVIDGTPCTFPEDSFDMCINGQCRKAGCDYVLNSDAKLDQCGVCNGNNTTCLTVSGQLYTGTGYTQTKQNSIHKVSPDKSMEFHIPDGSTNINIVHKGYMKDACFLSLMSGNEIIFNDPIHPTSHTTKHRLFAGVRLEYTVHGSQERITSTYGRPLKEKLTVRIVRKQNSDKTFHGQVEYHYLVPSTPVGNTQSNAIYSHHDYEPYKHPHHTHYSHHNGNSVHRLQQSVSAPETPYRWEMGDWLECDHLCTGKRRRPFVCRNSDTRQEAKPENCNHSAKPQDLNEFCNTECKFEWESGPIECSNACGEGFKQVEYLCVKSYPMELRRNEYVHEANCLDIPKPITKRDSQSTCTGPCKNATWNYSSWNKCSCTDGTQNRTATCLSDPNGFQIDDAYCEVKERKVVLQSCDAEEQECATWVAGELTPCSVTCGEGQRAYALQCMLKNVSVNAALCGTRPVPVILNCTMPPCDQKQMPNTQYSSFRNDVQPNQSMKNGNYQPNAESGPVPRGQWRTYNYSNCSAECKGGVKKRLVRCMSKNEQVLEDRYCSHPKPPTQINCANFRCPTWNFGQWSKCNNECKRSRQVLCQDHRGNESDQCAKEMKPPDEESCCNFKWRITCSGTCDAEGRRRPVLICKKLFPKSIENPKPFRNGRRVEEKYCASAPKPALNALKPKKKCNKRCPRPPGRRPSWETSPWSKCSVGCGFGRTVRNVTCTDGRKILPKACNETTKPPNTKICQSLEYCKWKTIKLFKCNCKGKQQRTVKCFDELLNTESNLCPENERPHKTIACPKPPGCDSRSRPAVYRNCKDVQLKHRTDGEYEMKLNGTIAMIYCHKMATRSPVEYLTLPAGPRENYAIYNKRRAADANSCQESPRDWEDESINYGATHYRKIRINVNTLLVHTNDFEFTTSSGTKQPFGSAGDCYSNTGHCPQGDLAINLTGTPFRIRPSTSWETAGVKSVMNFLVPLKAPYQKVRARCGGYCGSCSVSRNSNLYLEPIPVPKRRPQKLGRLNHNKHQMRNP